jgi:hypothetical protein
MGWAYFIISIAGAVSAIYYTKTGTLISVTGVIEERLIEKIRSRLEKKQIKEDPNSLLNRVEQLEQIRIESLIPSRGQN